MATKYTADELEALGYSREEIESVLGARPKSVNPRGLDASDWTEWLLTSSSNVAAIRYNAATEELQVQFHPPEVKRGAGRASSSNSAGHGSSLDRTYKTVGSGRLTHGHRPHGHDSGNYSRHTAPGFSEGYGPIYAHYGVPESAWAEFESASDSYGEFYWKHLRNRYGVTKISG